MGKRLLFCKGWCISGMLLALMAGLAGRPAWAVSRAKVVVVPLVRRGGPAFQAQVPDLIEAPLHEHGDIVPMSAFAASARRLGVRPAEFGNADAVTRAATPTGATHVLILDGAVEKLKAPRRGKAQVINVQLVDVVTGDVLLQQRYELRGRKLDASVANAILDAVAAALGPAPAASTPEPESKPKPKPPPDELALAPLTSVPSEANKTVAPDAATPRSSSATSPPQATAQPQPTPAPAPSEAAAPPLATADLSGRKRPALRATAALALVQRWAEVVDRTATVQGPCYCRDDGGANPFFGATYLAAELYPLALLHDSGGTLEGLGLHLEGLGSQVRTSVDAGAETTSDVWQVAGGFNYRWVWWNALTAPDLNVKLGMSHVGFTIPQSAFPSAQYWGLGYAGGTVTVPLATPYLAVLLGGSYTWRLSATGGTARLGEERSAKSNAIRYEGGARLSLLPGDVPLEVLLLARYDQLTTKYKGPTTLRGDVQFNDVRLDDDTLAVIVGLGLGL